MLHNAHFEFNFTTRWLDAKKVLADVSIPPLTSTTLAVPHASMPYSIPAVQYHLICHMYQTSIYWPHICRGKKAAKLWLRSNPQLNKHEGHLQVGRLGDICLLRQSTLLF